MILPSAGINYGVGLRLQRSSVGNGHVCSRFIRRGNNPIVWCKYSQNDNDATTHDKHGSVKKGIEFKR